MSKLRATRAQVIAAAIIVVLAVVLGGVGLYGMNARGSENGAQVLENMRLQAILNTAGSGAVDAYVRRREVGSLDQGARERRRHVCRARSGGQSRGRGPRRRRKSWASAQWISPKSIPSR